MKSLTFLWYFFLYLEWPIVQVEPNESLKTLSFYSVFKKGSFSHLAFLATRFGLLFSALLMCIASYSVPGSRTRFYQFLGVLKGPKSMQKQASVEVRHSALILNAIGTFWSPFWEACELLHGGTGDKNSRFWGLEGMSPCNFAVYWALATI